MTPWSSGSFLVSYRSWSGDRLKIAVFGSRKGWTYEEIAEYLEPRFRPDVTLVSGGAEGVDSFAETVWQTLGGHIISFRVKKISLDDYSFEKWDSREMMVNTPPGHPEWADWVSAAYYRDTLIAEEADRGVAFWANHSRGTAHTMDAFVAEGKPCSVHKK